MRIRLLPFVFFLLCALVTNAQKVSYSEPGGNLDHIQFNIIGSVKNRIIVWEYFHNDYSTSQILVYDNDLKLLNKVKIGSISRFALLDFINEKDSFDVIYQYVSNYTFFCKRLSFDENGNSTRLETLKSYPVSVDIIARKDYRVIQSPDKKNFILVSYRANEGLNKTLLSYILFANNKTRFEHSTELPYNRDSATSNNFSLDNANHLMIVASEGTENNKLELYEINPGTGDIAGIKGAVQQGILNMESLNINNINDHIFITAQWSNKEYGIFVWQPDLYNFSAGKDTIYILGTDMALSSLRHTFLKTDVYPWHNTYNFFIAANQGGSYNPDYNQNQYPASGYSEYHPESSNQGSYYSGSFYDGKPTSVELNNSKTINGVNTANAYNDRDANPTLSNVSQKQFYSQDYLTDAVANSYSKLLIYNIDENRNLHWYTYLADTIENGFTSYINISNSLYTNQLYLFCDKVDRNNIQMMNLLTIDNNGTYSFSPVVIMKTSYKYIFNLGKKINEKAVVYPCSVRNKLAFIKVEVK